MARRSSPPVKKRNRSRSRSRSPPPILPPELVDEILTWLPVRSLLRFRCVSKSFKTLISSPDFIKTHLRNAKALSSRTKPNPVERLITRSEMLDCHSYSLNSLYANHHPQAAETDLVRRPEYVPVPGTKYKCLVGSCDGILCALIGGGVDFVLWNPSTRACTRLPEIGTGPSPYSAHFGFGFGHDRQLDDYKAVALFTSRRSDDVTLQTVFQVCGLKPKLWRTIEAFDGFPVERFGKFAAGCLHWAARVGKPYWKTAIISLDLASETCKEVMLPEFGAEEEAIGSWTLEALDDCLYVMACNISDNSFAVWMMKEHGVRGSWTKLFRVLHDDIPASASKRLMYLSNSGEVLFWRENRLLVYDINHKTVRFLTSVDGFQYDSHVYLETLVSPGLED